ncbi:MAG: hypothetical protein NUV69_04495 [Candidatus Curtissbacteria bacterium]|nr:hypothetical protein [Candidatus Curtissbacteria bacterium]
MASTTKKALVERVGNALSFSAFPNIVPPLLSFLAGNPNWESILLSAVGLYGVYLAANQDELNDITKFINEHPDEFSEEIVKTDGFKKAFLVFLDGYLKERLKTKKEFLQKVILGYTQSEEKDKYELERLQDCFSRISLDSLEFLVFWKKEMLPKIEGEITERVTENTQVHPDRSKDWWHEHLLLQESFWSPLEKWLYDNYKPDTPKVKEEYGIPNQEGWPSEPLKRAQTREIHERAKVTERLAELTSLGILNIKVNTATIGGGSGKDFSLTLFGLNFIEFLD